MLETCIHWPLVLLERDNKWTHLLCSADLPWPVCTQRMVQHALALEKGASYKDLPPAAAAKPKEEDGGLLGKIMGMFRSS